MRVSGLFTLLAAGVSVVMATEDTSTTTLTSTTTQTVTITRCDPNYADCPLNSATSEPSSTSIETTPEPVIVSTTSESTPLAVETTTTTTSSVETTTIISSTSSTPVWPASNFTGFVGPTGTGSWPTTIITTTPDPETSVTVVTASTTAPLPAAANGLVAHSGVVAAALVAVLALVF